MRTDAEDKRLREIGAWLVVIKGELPWPIAPRKGEPIPPCSIAKGLEGPCDCGKWHLKGDKR